MLNASGIPAELQQYHQWTVRHGKVLVNLTDGTHAKVNDPRTWSTFDAVCAAISTGGYDGGGFVFHPLDPFTLIDLDHCVDPVTRAVAPWAAAVVARFATYTEYSQSGTGLHLIVRATKPAGRCKRGPVEIYDDRRFCALTGDRVPGTPATIARRPVELVAFWTETFPEEPARPCTEGAEGPAPVVTADDAALLEQARAAKDGAKFRALYDAGDFSGYAEHQSGADLALCNLLVWWTDGDGHRADRLFRQSALMRDKWDSRRGETTYGALTMAKAVADYPPGRRRGGGNVGNKGAAVLVEPPQGNEPDPDGWGAAVEGLRAALAERDARIAALEGENAELRARFQGFKDVLANPHLPAAAKLAGLAAAFVVWSREDALTGPATGLDPGDRRVYLGRIGRMTGMSDQAAGRNLKLLTDTPAAVYTKRKAYDTTNPIAITDPDTGQLRTIPRPVIELRPRHDSMAGTLGALATFTPHARPPHGGRREPRRCPNCGERMTRHEAERCAPCNIVLLDGHAAPYVQDEGMEAPPARVDRGTTLHVHLERMDAPPERPCAGGCGRTVPAWYTTARCLPCGANAEAPSRPPPAPPPAGAWFGGAAAGGGA